MSSIRFHKLQPPFLHDVINERPIVTIRTENRSIVFLQVKELDDIEAISQQISQHAEVLYQSWKNNGMTQGPGKFKLPTTSNNSAPSSPMSGSPTTNGVTEGASGSSASQPSGSTYTPNGSVGSNTFPRRGFQLERSNTPDPPGNPYHRQNGGTDYNGRVSPDPYSRQSSLQPQVTILFRRAFMDDVI